MREGSVLGWDPDLSLSGKLLVLGIGLAVINAVMREFGFVVGGLGLVSVFAAGFLWFNEGRKRLWISPEENSFLVTNRDEEYLVENGQVTSIAVETIHHYSRAILRSTRRNVSLWIEGRHDPIRLSQRFLPGKTPDPLQPWIEGLIRDHTKTERESIRRGIPLTGARWELSRDTLTIREKNGSTRSIERSRIIAIDIVDGELRAWVDGEDEAVFRLPMSEADAWTLFTLLKEEVDASDRAFEEPADGSLGRVAFERRSARKTIVGLAACTVLFGTVGWMGLTGKLDDPKRAQPQFIGLSAMMAFFAACTGSYGVFILFNRQRCHEWGVSYRGVLGERSLLYRDIETFTYSLTSQYVNGAYAGTQYRMTFIPFAGRGARRIAFFGGIDRPDAELDRLRVHVSKKIAARMLTDLRKGTPVAWTPNLSLHLDGIEYRPGGILGRKQPEFLPFESFGGQSVNQGVWALFARGDKKPCVTEKVSAPNFYPGLELLTLLLRSATPAADPKGEKKGIDPEIGG